MKYCTFIDVLEVSIVSEIVCLFECIVVIILLLFLFALFWRVIKNVSLFHIGKQLLLFLFSLLPLEIFLLSLSIHDLLGILLQLSPFNLHRVVPQGLSSWNLLHFNFCSNCVSYLSIRLGHIIRKIRLIRCIASLGVLRRLVVRMFLYLGDTYRGIATIQRGSRATPTLTTVRVSLVSSRGAHATITQLSLLGAKCRKVWFWNLVWIFLLLDLLIRHRCELTSSSCLHNFDNWVLLFRRFFGSLFNWDHADFSFWNLWIFYHRTIRSLSSWIRLSKGRGSWIWPLKSRGRS